MLTPAHLTEFAKLQANPGWHWRNPEEAAIFAQLVERRLAVLDERERAAVMLEAQGYTQAQIAGLLNRSLTTISRTFQRIDAALYADLDGALDDMGLWRLPRGLEHTVTEPKEFIPRRGRKGCHPGGYRWRAA